MSEPHVLTELDAATSYASAWNRLDCTQFVELLAPDAHYASQWVFDELEFVFDISTTNVCKGDNSLEIQLLKRDKRLEPFVTLNRACLTIDPNQEE